MTEQLAPAAQTYSGSVTDPARWAVWQPRAGDVIVCTPPKCGTTWTQTILLMLANGGPDLGQKVGDLSHWIDADIGIPAETVEAALRAQTGRRVVKTHTPADGFPVWRDVPVISVYRHPLDVFFSLRKHMANMAELEVGNPLLLPVDESFDAWVSAPLVEDFDIDTLATLTLHYRHTALNSRRDDVTVLHYADMLQDGRRAVETLAQAAGFEADDTLLNAVTAASSFGAMKSQAENFAPAAGTGYWKEENAFFDSASSNKWEGKLSDAQVSHFRARLTDLVPDAEARAWLEWGESGRP